MIVYKATVTLKIINIILRQNLNCKYRWLTNMWHKHATKTTTCDNSSSLLAYYERRIEDSILKIPLKKVLFFPQHCYISESDSFDLWLHIITRTRGTQIWPPSSLWRDMKTISVYEIVITSCNSDNNNNMK